MKAKWKEFGYRAADPSNYRSEATGLGGPADAHYVWGDRYWKLRERVRQFDRDVPVLGQAVDRNLDNQVGTGLRWDPQTDDPEWNTLALELLDAWGSDPLACDFSGRLTFDEIERLGLRHQDIDGDAFVILDDASGRVRLLEGDRCDSPSGVFATAGGNDLVLGVELDPLSDSPVAYHFVRRRRAQQDLTQVNARRATTGELIRVPASQVVHIFDPKRITQNRGVTAFHAVFDRLALIDDIEFAELVKHEVASCIAAFVESEYRFPFGPRSTETTSDGDDLDYDEFRPGMITRLPPGAKVHTFSPNVTTGDSREQIKQIIREVGLAIGLPLELTMLVTSDTTFHGYRGVVEAYKTTARVRQRRYGRRLRSRIYRWKVDQFIAAGLLADHPQKHKHILHAPTWSYVDPEKDAKADALRQSEHLASPRQIWSERGKDYDQGVVDIAEDAARKVRAFVKAAEALEAEGVEIDWRELAGMSTTPTDSPGPDPAQQPAAEQIVSDEPEPGQDAEDGAE